MSGVRGTILIPDFTKLSRRSGNFMGDGGDENESEASLEGVDAAGGSQTCGGDRGGGSGVAASESSLWDAAGVASAAGSMVVAKSCLWDAAGAACVAGGAGSVVVTVSESLPGSLGGEAGALF